MAGKKRAISPSINSINIDENTELVENKQNTGSKFDETTDTLFPVVGVGASAGGLEALESFFRNIKSDCGLSFVVIQHLSPDYKSLMGELLAKYTDMPIYRSEDGMRIKKNSVYLIPPKKNMTIFHNKLYLTDQRQTAGLNLPIDIFFRSLAEDHAERAIGVVLSGTGSDGTLGIRAIKGAGGMVMAQDEASAKFDGMPKSAIATGLVDYVLPPNEMGDQLIKYVAHPLVSGNDVKNDTQIKDDDAFSKILAAIRSRTSTDFTYYKPNTIVRRIERRISVHQFESIDDYMKLIVDSPTEVNILYKELLIGVTKFFRDSEAYDIVKHKVIPSIFKKKGPNEPIRVWVTACSTGEEAYSLAILFKEFMELENVTQDVKIFATDIDKDSIEYASSGVYPESIVTDVSEDRLRKYFNKNNNTFKINDTIRQMVIFATHNLIKDPPFSKIDFISCRNLLIYLQPIMQKKVLTTFSFSLNTSGYLFLGTSESIGELSNYFSIIDNKWKVYQNGEGIKQSMIDEFYVPVLRRHIIANTKDQPVVKSTPDSELFDDISESLFKQFVPAAVVINEKFDIVHVYNDINKFVKLPIGKISLNILNMVPSELSIAIGTAIHRIVKEKKEIIYNDINFEIDGQSMIINLLVKPFIHLKSKANLILLIFLPVEKSSLTDESTERFDIGSNIGLRIKDLEQELKYTKENLQATIEELETSNEELQATNEELIASNEELQSTNEELQSVNEELYTVNSEYQNKIEELTELNNDINNWFNVTSIGTIFLDLKLRVRKFTPAVTKFVNLIENDLGRPINHISYNFHYDSFFIDIENVLKTLKPVECELKTLFEKWFLLKILPYRTIENAVKGIVITFIDITQTKQYEDQIVRSRDLLHRILENSPLAQVMVNKFGSITYANKKALEIFGLSEEELIKRTYNDQRWKSSDKSGIDLTDEKKPFSLILKTKKSIFNFYEEIDRPDGSRMKLVINGSPIFDKDEKVDGAVFAIREHTNDQ